MNGMVLKTTSLHTIFEHRKQAALYGEAIPF
jgi:hypothetical protein